MRLPRDYARTCVDIQLKNVMMPGGSKASLALPSVEEKT
jgi:hypothetical protein